MTQKTKLKIIGEYREDHPGPFCTRDGRPVELKMRDGRGKYPIAGYVGSLLDLWSWTSEGAYLASDREVAKKKDLMCAREVPVAREFWVNQYAWGLGITPFTSPETAARNADDDECKGQVLFREVLPGEGA